jgi:UDP:flavonoid glycosyltransferase YjiC (YdhE family)
MKILFIPCHIGGYAHFIPLLVINKMLKGTEHSSAFLLSKHAKENYEPYYKNFNIDVLDTDYNGTLKSAKEAYVSFKPDVIVDDFSLSACFLCQVYPTPRITIQRTGIFPFDKPVKEHHKHSSSVSDSKFSDVTALGLRPLKSLSDLFIAELKIVPGIRSLEVLPEMVKEDSSYYFSGPLILEDGEIAQDLVLFFKKNKPRKKIYLTYGSAQKPPADISKCVEYILKSDLALITNVQNEECEKLFPETFYYAQYLPMNFVCSQADMAIHHCGSATYHYPVIHKLNTITIGTACYDRENVALRLQKLNIASHISSPGECEDFVLEFQNKFNQQINESESSKVRRIMMQEALNKEMQVAKSNFDFDLMLIEAVNIFNENRKYNAQEMNSIDRIHRSF